MIYLVTDSTAYLSRAEAQELSAIVVPMHYIKDGRETFQESFVEESQPAPGQVLSGYSTAQAPYQAFLKVFSRLKREGHQALCLCISSRLSGTFFNAAKAAEEAGGDVIAVDSLQTAGVNYLLLREARRLLDAGQGLKETAERLEPLIRRARTIFTLEDMEPLRRSGRLGFMRSSVSTLLNLRPLLTLRDGSVVSHSLARGRQDQLRQLAQDITGKPAEVLVQYCGDEKSADSLCERLREKGYRVMKRRLGMVLAIHLGLPILSTAWIEQST